MRLRTKLLALVISVTLVSGITIGAFVYSIAQRHLADALEKEVRVAAQASLSLIDQMIQSWQRDLRVLAGDVVFEADGDAYLERSKRLQAFRNGNRVFVNISYYDQEGVKTADSDALNLGETLPRTLIRDLQEGDVAFRVVRPKFLRDLVIELIVAVRGDDQKIGGALVGRIPVLQLEQRLAASQHVSSSELDLEAMVLTSDGDLVCATDPEIHSDGRKYTEFLVDKLTVIRASKNGVRVLVPGKVGLGDGADVWVMSVFSKTASFNRALLSMRDRIAVTIGVTLLFLVMIVFGLTAATFSPLNQLLRAIHQLGEGANPQTVTATGELGALSSALNDAAAKRIQVEDKLRKANEDLNAFVYIVSHDLRAPLRAIDMIADWVREDCPGDLGEQADQHLTTLKGRVARMKKYLDDLLEYSRIGRVEAKEEFVEMRALVDDAIQLSGVSSQFEISSECSFESFTTHRAPLLNVMLNLISNAAKHHDHESGKIIVRCEKNLDRVRIEVEDDGPGIPDEFHTRVFQIFTTLQPRDKVEGSGMGLAFVKKTVENFGGKVWIESGVVRGARICFTWPLKRQAIPQPGENSDFS